MSEVIDLSYSTNLRCRATLAASGQELLTDPPRQNGGAGEASRPPTSWPPPWAPAC